MKVWLRQKQNSLGEILKIGMNLRLRQKMILSSNTFVESEVLFD